MTDDTDAEQRAEAEAAQRYRTITGMDDPMADRIQRAEANAKTTPLTRKTW